MGPLESPLSTTPAQGLVSVSPDGLVHTQACSRVPPSAQLARPHPLEKAPCPSQPTRPSWGTQAPWRDGGL